jgi:hypothetical protein
MQKGVTVRRQSRIGRLSGIDEGRELFEDTNFRPSTPDIKMRQRAQLPPTVRLTPGLEIRCKQESITCEVAALPES